MTYSCTSFCYSGDDPLSPPSPTLDLSDLSKRTLLFLGVYPKESAYAGAPGPLEFSITGFTNPASTSPATFQWTSYAFIEGKSVKID
jgi:hypothetical protein